ncbi:acid protease [Daedaleopsis nitida]|nr:acid protease [Daedaleopsis nitida]
MTNNGADFMTMMMNDNIGVNTADGIQYAVEITLGGQNFTVILDTGSTDLWVDARGRDVQLTNTTSIEATEVYGQGQTSGNIAFADLKIGEYAISSQVFLNATQVSSMPPGVQGILGMAFDNAQIFATLQMAWGPDAAAKLGHSPITNLFAMNESLPNNFDIQLGRPSGLGEVNTGTFVISGHASGYEDVAQAPKLPRVRPEHWSLLLDEMRINDERFTFAKSSVPGVPEGKVVAVLDTGFSLPPLPKDAVDAIYSQIDGATFYNSSLVTAWVIPCNSSVELSFVFGGREFMVHPLDLTLPQAVPIVENGSEKNVTVCFATYQYLTLDPAGGFGGFDLILGDAFLRSVYASFDYGDFNPTNHTNGLPFVQLVSTVDPHTAMNEFFEDRSALLAQLPPTIEPSVFAKATLAPSLLAQANASNPSTSGSGSVSGALAGDEEDSGSQWMGLSKTWGIVAVVLLAANLLVGLVLVGITLTMCVRGMKGKSRAVGQSYAPVRLKEAAADDDAEGGALNRYSD